ncbi:hypothetical protein COCON_G00100160 [Conger conger]|uniref:Glycerophosphocholine phosphodiesterase GPCPD1 n=1 Tax=Conger conger TaxID=82655 RepID=A0A9Q1I117_CONCO|nr:hypothetical protein COCON_G00100160 [Conger conger]
MDLIQITLSVRGPTSLGEQIGVVGSCESLGNWCSQRAVPLQAQEADGSLWKHTIYVPKGVECKYRYFKGFFLESKNARDPCQVIVNKWETHRHPRAFNSESDLVIDDGEFGLYNDVQCVDSGWLTWQTEIRLRLHFSEKSPVSITKKKFKKSRFRLKLSLEGFEEEGDDEEQSPCSCSRMASTLEMSMISAGGYRSRHSQPEHGYALEPGRWTEYSIHTMDPDNLELTFEFFEEDLGECVLQGDVHPGLVGTACLLSSSFHESGRNTGLVTLPIMSRISRQTIGKVRVDYLVIRPIKGLMCDMSSCFTKYWRKRSALDVGHRGAGSTRHAAKHTKVRENTIASFKSAASHGAAYVEFDVHLSKDFIPIVYHDLTCCISTKKKNDKHSLELFEVPVKDLTFHQLQLLKLAHATAMKVNEQDSQDEEEYIAEHQPFPSLDQIFQAVPEHVGFNIELKWITRLKDGSWEGDVSSYFDMNLFLDIILKCVHQNAGKRRIVFSCFDPDVCSMVRRKQNRYPILFLTQGVSMVYPELMDIRCQTTPIAMSFAQSEDILGVSMHTEDLLRNMDTIGEAHAKGLVLFCWGDDNNQHETRHRLREHNIDGLIYDSICDEALDQLNIFKMEEQMSLQEMLPEQTLKSCACPSYSLPCASLPCPGGPGGGSGESDSGLSSS